jgi:site-specific recombinase XerD
MRKQIQDYNQWLKDSDRADLTRAAYKKDAASFCSWLKGQEVDNLSLTTRQDARRYTKQLEGRYKPTSINRIVCSLRLFFNFLTDQGETTHNPFSGIRTPRQQKNVAPLALSVSDVRRLKRAAQEAIVVADARPRQGAMNTQIETRRNEAILLLFLGTGARVVEVQGLQLADVVLSDRSGNVTYKGKGNKERTVPLNNETIKALNDWIRIRPQGSDFLFVSNRNKRLQVRSIQHIIERLGRRANIEKLHPHKLRHTAAKLMLDRGVPLTVIAQILGHESIATTAIYTRPTQDDLAAAVALLED